MNKKWYVKPSNIHGVGVFSLDTIFRGETIDHGIYFLAYVIPLVTKFGSKINHSFTPNTALVYNGTKNTYDIVAIRHILPHTELTLDYRGTPFYIQKPEPHW